MRHLHSGVAAALAPLALPAPGHPQPLADVPLRPWVDHHGRINQDLWVGLVQRAVCAAMQCPGIKGDVLLQSVRVVNPQHGRELLRVLCKEGVLRTERTPGPDASSPKSVLDACFGGRSGEDEGSGDGAEVAHGEYGSGFFGGGDDDQWHFFAVPERCWGLEKVLPSQVILKQ